MDLDAIGRRLFNKDTTLWPNYTDIENRLGWLTIIEPMARQAEALRAFAEEIRGAGFRRVLLLGMGGSSLCPEVLRETFGAADGFLDLRVLDSTVPAAVRDAEAWSREERTLFLVSSKSGTTLEVLSFYKYFAQPGDRCVAITDPGTPLEALAKRDGFRRTFLNPPDVGGRYSALSYFGLVPAALLGIDPARLLERARAVARPDGPGTALGGRIAEAARRGRDKLTLGLDPEFASLGRWIEQLIAESTGKEGQGILPVDGEPPGPGGDDRHFEKVTLKDPYDLGAEFFRWEVANAVVGSILGMNPFDEPDVNESKETTRTLLSATLPKEDSIPDVDRDALAGHLGRARDGDYVAWLAFLHRTDAVDRELQAMRKAVCDRRRLATTVGYGPRYLHSTGQFHKGGPNSGLFIMITADDAADVPIPGEPYGFARLKQAQALGDFQTLVRSGRRILRCHLSGDVVGGLRTLRSHCEKILGS